MNNPDWNKKFHWMYGIEEYLRFVDHPAQDQFNKITEAVVHGDNWAIRDLIIQETQRGFTDRTEQFVNTIMLSHLHQDLPDFPSSHLLEYVNSVVDDQFIHTVSNWTARWQNQIVLGDHFGRGQIRSKLWMISELEKIIDNQQLGTVLMYGGWYATVAALLFQRFGVSQFYNIDLDPVAIQLSNDFNQAAGDRFSAITGDVCDLQYQDAACRLPNGDTVRPTVVINTSCEHMSDAWFYDLPDGQFVVLQTNNYFENPQHINCVPSVDAALEKYQFNEVFYSGEIETMLYNRYMIIGVK